MGNGWGNEVTLLYEGAKPTCSVNITMVGEMLGASIMLMVESRSKVVRIAFISCPLILDVEGRV